MKHLHKKHYRPEVDGIRAISVIAIIVYHAQISIYDYKILQGGFLGVDVFFVISGYLITGILFRENQRQSFTFSDFYFRRIKRIIPAFIAMVFITTIYAWVYLLPVQFVEYAYSLINSLTFTSNMYFWYIAEEYGGDSSLLKPLLHTWSLSVEEQFYLFFPVVIAILFRFDKKNIFPLFVIAAILSLCFSHILSSTHYGVPLDFVSEVFPYANQFIEKLNNAKEQFAFYTLPSRAWELLAGAIIAYLHYHSYSIKSKNLANVLSLLAVGAILVPMCVYSDNIHHPSFFTLIPVLGTCLILLISRKETWINSILAARGMVAVGLVSYSLYLWHYPIFSFARIVTINNLTLYDKTFLIFITVIIAITSYYLVEKPFRYRWLTTKKQAFGFFFVSSLIMLFIGMSIIQNKGFVNRMPSLLVSTYNELGRVTDYPAQDGLDCFGRKENFCRFNKEAKKTIILLGDSHMAALEREFLNFGTTYEYETILMNFSACQYIPKTNWVKKSNNQLYQCSADIQEKRKKLLLGIRPSIIVIGGRLPLILSGESFNNQEGGSDEEIPYILQPENKFYSDNDSRADFIRKSYVDAINELIEYGHQVIVVYPSPEVGWHVPKRLNNLFYIYGDKFEEHMQMNPITTSLAVYYERSKSSFELLDSISRVSRVYPHKIVCSEELQRCFAHDKTASFYYDSDHFSFYGTKLLMEEIGKEIKSISK